MHKKFDIIRTKIKGGCQLGRKVVAHNSESDLPLVCHLIFGRVTLAAFFVKVRLIFNAYFSLQANSCRKAIKLYCPIGRGNVLECLKSLEHKKMSDHCRAAVFEEEQEEVLIQGIFKIKNK